MHGLEGGDPLPELGGVALDQRRDVAAGSFSSIPEGERFPDLPQTEPDRLGGTDEPEAIGGLPGIIPVSALGPGGVGHEPDPLVVPDRRRFDARSLGQFTDPHGVQNNPLTF